MPRSNPPDEPEGRALDSNHQLSRRQFLLIAGLTAETGLLAGCNSRENDDRHTVTTTPIPTPDTTTSEPPTTARIHPPTAAPRSADGPLKETYPGLRSISRDPPVGEAESRATYTQYVTPIEDHYVVNHYETPEIDARAWTVTLSGLTGSDVNLSMRELRENYSTTSETHTMQCSGNGRAYFNPEISGYSLSFGAVGTAIWRGTPLSEVLKAHGADTRSGTWLTAAGGDNPEGERVFARSIPMEKAMTDCLLAYEMNGEPLPREHGYPVRLVVPGWFGNNSVKWVDELRVMDRMLSGDAWRRYAYWQQQKYRILPTGDTADEHRRIDRFDTWSQLVANVEGGVDYLPYMYDQVVKSLIGHPTAGSISPREQDGKIEVLGVAWAGDERVSAVEVSTDGGETWSDATLFGPDRGPSAWRRFRYLWTPTPGEHLLLTRATDERGRTQPRDIADPAAGLRAIREDAYPWNQRGYGNNAHLPHGVHVTVDA